MFSSSFLVYTPFTIVGWWMRIVHPLLDLSCTLSHTYKIFVVSEVISSISSPIVPLLPFLSFESFKFCSIRHGFFPVLCLSFGLDYGLEMTKHLGAFEWN
ncbi:unnamed protein product [Citrullus colocynthis]|uniref:Uncharacterized protein n=1 Tax=Citrullus colocynthis TaxID=252529 RepID=A0ABP0YM53_9ROSI